VRGIQIEFKIEQQKLIGLNQIDYKLDEIKVISLVIVWYS